MIMKKHIKTSPFLIGTLEPEDEIHVAKQKSWINNNEQMSFFGNLEVK